jgi:putative nucleotidyltransferase with HDIG domain
MATFATWSEWVESDTWIESGESAMPMLPALAADVMSLAIDPDVSVARIARVIAKDQVLATRVLRLANSAYCAPMQEITTVNDAIVRMGTGPVRNVVLAVCFTSRLEGANIYGSQGRDLMDHAIGSAYLARLVAERLGEDADEGFMCGLLHDLGKLLLLKLSRDFIKYGAPTPSTQEIEQVYKDRHPEIGARLLKQWQLPVALEQPVRFHHDPDSCVTHKSQAIVAYLANKLAHRYGFGCPAEQETENLLEDALCMRAGLNEKWLADLDRRAPGLFQVARQIVA